MDTPKPLFQPGIQVVSLGELRRVCVGTFPGNVRRQTLFGLLEKYLVQFTLLHAHFTFWIDGSFVTSKTNPGDIDVVVWFDVQEIDALPHYKQGIFSALVDNASVRDSYHHIDVYCRPNGEDVPYWLGLFGKVKESGVPKGIPVIILGEEHESNSMA